MAQGGIGGGGWRVDEMVASEIAKWSGHGEWGFLIGDK